ncbi:MAG: M28 family metallopeptidase, partial [Terriglobales bacterium]
MESKVKGSHLPNVVCTLPGASDSLILVGAHYDLAEMGKGVVDNWSGASLLPTLFESLHQQERKHTFVFIGFTDEEKGLVGSKFYASNLTAEVKTRIRAMVNLDTLGLSPTKVWVSRADRGLAVALRTVAQAMNLPLQGVNVEKVGSTDSESFASHN